MQQGEKGSVTVEAALLYPFLLLITFLLVQMTLRQYQATAMQSAQLYDAVFTERNMQSADLIRATDAAFDFFEK
ncbi:MAG: pilus assembly protein [Lachnospiraceae bacterium]|nr:pilus assembly protein [Lachnospiraceae bacterium]